VGYQEGRGDIVTLVPAKFAPLEPEKQWFENEDFMNAVKVALTSLIFLVILLTIIRPVVNLLTGQTMSPKEIAKMELEAQKRAQEESAQRVAQEAEAKAIAEAEAKAAAGEDGTEGKEGEGADGEGGKGTDGEDLPATELSPEELGMIEMQEGESLYSVAGQWRTNWLDVWSGNPHIKNPSTPPAYSALRMGPIYRAMQHDTVSV